MPPTLRGTRRIASASKIDPAGNPAKQQTRIAAQMTVSREREGMVLDTSRDALGFL